MHLINEVVSRTYGSSLCAGAFKNESIHSDNCSIHELDPLQSDWKDGKQGERFVQSEQTIKQTSVVTFI